MHHNAFYFINIQDKLDIFSTSHLIEYLIHSHFK